MDIPSIQYNETQQSLICQGSWTILTLTSATQSSLLLLAQQKIITVDILQISQFDSAGAKLILQILQQHPSAKLQIKQEQQNLLTLIKTYPEDRAQHLSGEKFSWLERVGRRTYHVYRESLYYLAFMGEVFFAMLNWLRHPGKILWRNIARVVETTGYDGTPIVGLLSLLIGIVLAYQMGVQLETYGASIFVVDLLGISILREFAPLITAIIVAGRTGSAFTAELGMMKVNQEIDALTTMGVKPIKYLVLPKIIGLLISFPLLCMWAAFMGIFGGMLMAKGMLGITFHSFWVEFQQGVAIKQFWIGLMKMPVFAFIIASTGCFQGMQVTGGAESVGLQTTRSVVQSLFLIIVADAFFSIILSFFHA